MSTSLLAKLRPATSLPRHISPRSRILLPSQSCHDIHARRALSTTTRLPARKASQDKDSINRESTEYSRSGTDDEVAGQAEAAFDPKTTRPEQMREVAGQGNGKGSGVAKDRANPLDVSPANPEVSKQRPMTEGGAENSKGESGGRDEPKRQSGAGSPQKGKSLGQK